MEALAKLKNAPFPARKMRLIADNIRGLGVDHALHILKNHPKKMYAIHMEKVLLSAVANWQMKHEDESIEESELYIKSLTVDNARQLKRIRPAPQGRAHRIRKRFNHITLIVDSHKVIDEPMLETEDNTEQIDNDKA
jgi:large subunit ribosomal protein L22